MSIQSQINRIAGNVTAALTAIGNKGVTVPSGSDSDDLADLIAAIPVGLTLAPSLTARRTANRTISFTNLLAEPRFFVLYAPAQIQHTSSGSYRVVFVLYDGTSTYGASIYYRSDQAKWEVLTTYTYSWNNSAKTLTITSPTSRQFQNTFDYKLLYLY